MYLYNNFIVVNIFWICDKLSVKTLNDSYEPSCTQRHVCIIDSDVLNYNYHIV